MQNVQYLIAFLYIGIAYGKTQFVIEKRDSDGTLFRYRQELIIYLSFWIIFSYVSLIYYARNVALYKNICRPREIKLACAFYDAEVYARHSYLSLSG